MIIFDQLRISDDGRRMYINLHVNMASYFDNIYLDSIAIMTADKVSETNPYQPTEDAIYNKVFEGELKQADLVITPNDCTELFTKDNFSSDLFFVYVKAKGIPEPCTPCRLDEEITLGVTFDEALLYQKFIQLTKQLADDCKISKDYIDMILLWNGFKAAIETEHYIPAIDFWKKLFFGHHGMIGLNNFRPCGCHG